jgi:peptide/nickel transport system ATP-binding protein
MEPAPRTVPRKKPRPILSIRDLTVVIEDESRRFKVLDGLSLDVPRGTTVAVVGESGSGKTIAALAVLNLLPRVARVTSGAVDFGGTDLLGLDDKAMCDIRGNRIGMIFQEPSTSLNPLMQVGRQIGESLKIHKGLGRAVTKEQVLALMEMVGIPDPRRRYRHYPHQLSGGVRQRVVIAMALACRPDLLLADEPTTALDATVQAQIIDLMARLIRDLRMSVLLITHDLGVVASLADRVAVLHAGIVVEEGPVRSILKSPRHPYTEALLEAGPTERTVAARHSGLAHLRGSSPSSEDTGRGCPLATTCRRGQEVCSLARPDLVTVGPEHRVRCLILEEGAGG